MLSIEMFKNFQETNDIVIGSSNAKVEPPQRPNVKRDEDGEVITQFQVMTRSLGNKIARAREDLGWKRKDLALKVQTSEKIIEEMENGKGRYNHQLVQKIEKVTGRKFYEN